MKELIVGATGFVGRHMAERLPDAMVTTRALGSQLDELCDETLRAHRDLVLHRHHLFFDLLKPEPLPEADIVYNCAGVNGNVLVKRGDETKAYRVNVDGAWWIADNCPNSFVVCISSMSAEWTAEGYGGQKRTMEVGLHGRPNVAIIRAGLIIPANIDEFCELMISIGRARVPGLTRWNEDDTLGRWK